MRKAVLLILSCLLIGCGVKKHVTTASDTRDSVVVRHVTVADTLHVVDTVTVEIKRYVETDEGVTIQFAEGGGSFNAQTGQADGVQSINMSRKVREQADEITRLTFELSAAKQTADSLRMQSKVGQIMSEATTEPPRRSGWDRFCTWYTIISWILLLLAVAWWVFKRFYLHI